MQELVVTLEYDRGIDYVIDLFIDYPRAISTSKKSAVHTRSRTVG